MSHDLGEICNRVRSLDFDFFYREKVHHPVPGRLFNVHALLSGKAFINRPESHVLEVKHFRVRVAAPDR